MSAESFNLDANRMAEIRRELEVALWVVQSNLQPDSVHVLRGEALGWMYEDNHDGRQRRMECWDEANEALSDQRISDRLAYYERCVMEERWNMSRAVATAMSHDVGIFFMSGPMQSGMYRNKGFRYGLAEHQVLSAFTE